MIFNRKRHSTILYNTLLHLSRNLYFYSKINLKDTFETRIYLMFIHFSIILIVYKSKKIQFPQNNYDSLFYYIENDLRELGYGDVAVNKKMKDLNKILYDILLKIEENDLNKGFHMNPLLTIKYFNKLGNEKSVNYKSFSTYFSNFYDFCFELPLKNMLNNAINFKQ